MKTPAALSSALLIVCACVAGPISIANAWAWAKCLRSGVVEGTYSRPIYGPMVVPDGQGFGAGGKLAADHASLYFTAKDYLARSQMYDPSVDPWGRTAETFPPYLVYLTAHSTARFDFVSSALLNNFAQVLLFVVASAYFLHGGSTSWALKTAGLAAAAFAVFCTPVGVTWFERAQTDLYTASAILLLLKGMRGGLWRDFALAGLVASVKWSSLPFFALATLPYVFLAAQHRVRRMLLIGLSLSMPFLLLVFFGKDATRYLALVYESELGHFDGSTGVSLSRHFPRVASKLLPFIVPAFYLLAETFHRRRAEAETSSAELLFWATAGLVAPAYGTTAYEYRMLSAIFILPLVIDGRSILFPGRGETFSMTSRIVALGFLGYALRVETMPWVNMLISRYRAFAPLAVGVVLILAFALLDSWYRARFKPS